MSPNNRTHVVEPDRDTVETHIHNAALTHTHTHTGLLKRKLVCQNGFLLYCNRSI